jgi:hypothetical protein
MSATNILLYDIFSADGVYVRSVRCIDIHQQLAGGETAVLSDGSPPHQKVLVGAEVVLLPPQPSIHHRADPATQQWVDTRSLEQLKAAKWSQIKRSRDAAEYGGFTHNGLVFDSDPDSVQRISGAVTMAMIAASADAPFSIDWTLADNTVHTLTGEEVVQIGLALGAHVASVHATARTLRLAIADAADVEALAAIAWPEPPAMLDPTETETT